MTILEKNEIIRGKYKESLNTTGKVLAASEDVQLFRKLLTYNDGYFKWFSQTEDYKEFYEAFELFDKAFHKNLKEDVFFAAKLGCIFEGVPSRLAFIIKKALRENPTNNTAIESIDERTFGSYLKKGSLPEGITILDVIEQLVGSSVQLISSHRRKVENRDGSYDIYVQNVDRIVIVPKDIGDMINSLEDLKNINYRKGIGVCIDDTPLRTLNGRVGVTVKEYDLRESR